MVESSPSCFRLLRRLLDDAAARLATPRRRGASAWRRRAAASSAFSESRWPSKTVVSQGRLFSVRTAQILAAAPASFSGPATSRSCMPSPLVPSLITMIGRSAVSGAFDLDFSSPRHSARKPVDRIGAAEIDPELGPLERDLRRGGLVGFRVAGRRRRRHHFRDRARRSPGSRGLLGLDQLCWPPDRAAPSSISTATSGVAGEGVCGVCGFGGIGLGSVGFGGSAWRDVRLRRVSFGAASALPLRSLALPLWRCRSSRHPWPAA